MAYPVFEGVKQRAVSVQEAMSKARTVLKENWQCFATGKGPNCTKNQRKALGIISDFISGKWNKVKAALPDKWCWEGSGAFYGPCTYGVSLLVIAVIGMIIGILARQGNVPFLRMKKGAVYKPTNPEFQRMLLNESKGEATQEEREKLRKLYNIFDLLTHKPDDEQAFLQELNQKKEIMQEAGWQTTRDGKTLIGMVVYKMQGTPIQFKLRLIDHLMGWGIHPTDEEALKIGEMRRSQQPELWKENPYATASE